MIEKSANTLPESIEVRHKIGTTSISEKENSRQKRIEETAFDCRSEDNAESESKFSPPSWKSYIALVILFVVYICLNLAGAAIFKATERRAVDGTRHPFAERKREFVEKNGKNLTVKLLDSFLEEAMGIVGEVNNITDDDTFYNDPWTLNHAFLLSFTIASTIGYGQLTPKTEGGQMFALCFALISIPFTGLLAAKLGSILAYFIKKAATFIFGDRKSNRWVKAASIIFTLVVGLLIYIIIPSLVLAYVDNDEGWSFVVSLYCVFITLTTIGFGDYVPDPHSAFGMAGSILVLIWVVAGLAWVATIVNLIATTITKKASSIKKKVANQHFGVKSIKHRLRRKTKTNPPKTSSNAESVQEVARNRDEFFESNENNRNKMEPASSQDPSSSRPMDERRESKRDSVLGPSGIMAVVANNFEKYHVEVAEETE